MKNPTEQNKPVFSLLEVPGIQKTRGLTITKREQIKDIVEQPLIKACEVFWDKNIKTYESSANSGDIQSGFCSITLDFNSLSEENKEIAQQYGKPQNDVGVQVLDIKIPVSESTTVNYISDKALEIANRFKEQAATWISGTTLQEQLDYYEEKMGKKYPAEVAKEKERLSQPGAWEKECNRKGLYFDKETQTAYESEEWYKKLKKKPIK